MTATTMAAPALRRRSAMTQLIITELKLFTRGRAAVGLLAGGGFPLLLMIIFGSIHSFNTPVAKYGGLTTLDVYVPILLVFAMGLLSLIAMPATLAGYRELGYLRRLKTTPAGPVRVLVAELTVKLVVTAAIVIVLLAVASGGYGVAAPRQLGGFLVTGVVSAAALMAAGLFISAVASSAGVARGIGAVFFYLMMFFAGLWLPIQNMPTVLQHISHATPLGAAVPALQDATQGQWPSWLQLVTMAAYAVAFGLAAVRFFRWE
ncbi:ABC transporter permease [Trebonia sp.]|uniref:ABC transporter permease n=1 Tax=Trebonia sp. TaxID=2767075 RepID=UPI00260E04D0|nr:ABC transporter permease [Trebonia sp.]